MNTELKKNAEGYTDPTAAATLGQKEPGDIWTYMNQDCLILKNHGAFSTCLLLSRTRRNPIDVEVMTCKGARYTDPRKLTWGAHYKMTGYVDTCSLIDYGAVVIAVEHELGVKLPDKKETDWQQAAMQDLVEIEAEVEALRANRKALLEENAVLRGQLDQLTDLHEKAVDRVNKVNIAKLKVENQLELLQSTIGAVLARFQIDTEEV
jgi:hypothetical protein